METTLKKSPTPIPNLAADAFLIDSHCHLDMSAYKNDLDPILKRASRHNISHIISIGIDLDSSQKAIEIAKKHEMVHATVGIHPHDVKNIANNTYNDIGLLVEEEIDYIVGFGEIGLDYVKKYSSAELQRKHFNNQLALARELELPVIIHNREADDDTLALLKKNGPYPQRGVMHCFSGDVKFAMEIIELGFYISIPGIITYKNAHTLRNVVKEVPLSSMLIETDGPFLTPHPYRGKRNEPLFALYTAEEVAKILSISLDDVARETSKNTIELFGLPPTPSSL